MTETKVTLDQLNDFNWASWKFRMELLLMKENLWKTVNEEKPEEVLPTWTRCDEKARATIGLALEDNQLCHIMGAVSAKEMWDKLKGYHERGSLSNKIYVLRRLCTMRLTDDGSMSEHLVQASELVHRLASMGEPLKEHLVVAILLSSLPEKYNTLVTALEGRPEEDLMLDYVKGKLLDEWRRSNEDRMQKTSEKAMKTTVNFEERRSVAWTCYYCKKEGHLIRNCPVLERRQAVANGERNQSKSVVVKQSDLGSTANRKSVCFSAAAVDDVSVDGRWIIDTGCSRHMAGSTAKFDGMTFCDEKVLLADGRTVMAKGTGRGKIVGVDLDGDSVDMKLKEILYVPGLSTNILSVSQITSSGYGVMFGLTDCRILKGSEVVAVGDRINGLYCLRQPVLT